MGPHRQGRTIPMAEDFVHQVALLCEREGCGFDEGVIRCRRQQAARQYAAAYGGDSALSQDRLPAAVFTAAGDLVDALVDNPVEDLGGLLSDVEQLVRQGLAEKFDLGAEP